MKEKLGKVTESFVHSRYRLPFTVYPGPSTIFTWGLVMASKLVRRLGIILGVLILLIGLTGATLYVLSNRNMNKTYSVTPAAVVIPTDSASIERGRHLATARVICGECHGEDLGGTLFIDGMPFGRFVASNLTPGGVGATYTDVDWVRAIRHGIGPDGKSLMIMPSEVFAGLGAEDLGALIAYLKTLPPVTRSLPATRLGPIGRMLVATGQAPVLIAELIDHTAPIPTPPPAGETVEYGRYLVATGGCQGCHGENLSGGPAGGPDDPPAANITPTGIGPWSEAEFLNAFRTGKRPNGTDIHPFMPWKAMGRMTDGELRAIYLHLKTVPPRPYGQG
jgi:mono/diheme cytochrome c family protein